MNIDAQTQQQQRQPATDLAEEALEIVIKNASLDSNAIKALRLTCKHTKAAANDRVKQFILVQMQEPEAVLRSGLLNNIAKLGIFFNLLPSGDGPPIPSEQISHALGLLILAADVRSKSVEIMEVEIEASPQTLLACGAMLGKFNWESLKTLNMPENCSMPGFLSGVLGARPGSFPALKELWCQDPSTDDIEAINNSGLLVNLTELALTWSGDIYMYDSNTAPAMIAAMRTLLQHATKLEGLGLSSSTVEFFYCEELIALKTMDLIALNSHYGVIDPLLARPLTTLENLSIEYASFTGPNLISIFEAENTLPALKRLSIECHLEVDAVNALSCLRRPHLEVIRMHRSANGHVLISKLTELIKANPSVAPRLREFEITCSYDDYDDDDDPVAATVKALSEFLSCPCMAGLERLSLINVAGEWGDMGLDAAGLFCNIAHFCPKIKYLNLGYNYLGRQNIAMVLGWGLQGAWPELEVLEGLVNQTDLDKEDPNSLDAEHPYIPKLDVQQTLRRVWPKLECL